MTDERPQPNDEPVDGIRRFESRRSAPWRSADEPANWLEAIIREGEARRWCISTSCTTCGSNEFRRAVLVESARLAGVSLPSDLVAPWRVAAALPLEARMVLYKVQTAAVEELDGYMANPTAMSLVRWDVSQLQLQPGEQIPAALRGHPLVEQWVRDAKERERSRALERERWFARQEDARRRREEAKRTKLELRQQRHMARCEARKDFTVRRLALIEQLKRMSIAARLEWLAADETISIDALPADLFATTADIARLLHTAVRERVMERIDKRRGSWGRVRRQLQDIA